MAVLLIARAASGQQPGAIGHYDTSQLRAERRASASAEALSRLEYDAALRLAEDGLAKAPEDPWLLYDRGAALAGLGRTEEALDVLALSEQKFPASDAWARSVAAYRRALALEQAGRCQEASAAFTHYARVARSFDRALADQAIAHGRTCLPASERQNVRGRR